MENIKYILKRMRDMDYKAMIAKINEVHKKTKMGRIKIFLDMKDCAVKYGAGYIDYDLYEMYNLTDEQRKTYITRGRNNELVKKYCDLDYLHIFINKDEFNELFNDYLKRDWIKVDNSDKDKVMKFIKKHKVFMAKPIDGSCGKGIKKVKVENYNSIEEVYQDIVNQNYILEEVIKQHKDVSKIYDGAINTVRVVTIVKDNKPNIICAYFRIGNGAFVDNFNSGGMVAPVAIDTGVVSDVAIDKRKNVYELHPQTNTPIKGFQFPNWDEVMELCKKAAMVVPQMGYSGWDIAFTPKGPVIVEGNEFPGHDIYQLPGHTPNKIGVWDKFNI